MNSIKMSKGTNKRDNNLRSFVLCCFCQMCENKKCNAYKIFDKYMRHSLNNKQSKEIKLFKMEGVSCFNYIRPEEDVFCHLISIQYKTGETENPPDFKTMDEISEIWLDEKVEDINIVFTEVI